MWSILLVTAYPAALFGTTWTIVISVVVFLVLLVESFAELALLLVILRHGRNVCVAEVKLKCISFEAHTISSR